jgi:DNA-binding transcriptional ArsR family regulator
MPDEPDKSTFDKAKAELFDALGHPTRIKILHALEDGPLGFSELRRRVGLGSSGHLQFHLSRLDGLVQASADGNYALTDDGREALRLVGTVLSEQVTRRGSRASGFLRAHREAILASLLTALVILSAVAVINPTAPAKFEHVAVDSATIAWHPDNYTVSIAYHNDGTATMNLDDIILESYGLAYWRNVTVDGIEASQVLKSGISLPAGGAGTLTVLVPSTENWPFVVNQTIEVVLVSRLGNYYYTFSEVTSDGKTYVTLTDGLAGRVCQALLAPCPQYPTFLAVQEGSGQNISYNVTVTINHVPYTVWLNDSSYVVSPPLP